MSSGSSNFTSEKNFRYRKQKGHTEISQGSMEGAALAQSCVSSKTLDYKLLIYAITLSKFQILK